MSFRKLRKAYVEAADDTTQIKINKIKSESSVTTKTFINDQIFVETEFLPHRKRLFQVNMLACKSRRFWNVLSVLSAFFLLLWN